MLQAAGKVFAARGYYGATLDEVARAAGVSKGALYYNFASKEQLFLALLADRIGARIDEIARIFDEPATRKAGAAGTSFVSRLERDPRWTPLFFEFVAVAARSEEVRAGFSHWIIETRQRLASLIAQRFRQLEVEPPLPVNELAILVTSLANGMLIERIFDPDGVRQDLFGDALASLARATGMDNGGRR